jgi:spore coat protein CotH
MIKKYLLCILLGIAVCVGSCKKEVIVATPDEVTDPEVQQAAASDAVELLTMKLELKNNKNLIPKDVVATINDTQVDMVIPDVMKSTKKVVATFTVKNATVKVNGVLQTSGKTVVDFNKPVVYTLTSKKGTTKSYTVTVRLFTGLPILYLTTTGPIVSKDDYVNGKLVIDPNLSYAQSKLTIPLKIKGRGNSTWSNFPKKPYKMKFESKADMLGMPAAKAWVLLANYDDKTLMRTRIAFEFARRIKSDFAPQSRFVEVVLNGDFVGNYLLTSQVEVGENRVNIKELTSANTSTTDITGGYLLELDQRMDEPVWFKTKKKLPFTVKEPEEITAKQLAYIKDYMQKTETALFAANAADPKEGYAKYINSDSFINWFFVNEYVKNQDSRDFSSIYYYKDRGGKLGMGPVWDFDLSLGNVDYSVSKQPLDWYVRDATWMLPLIRDKAFRTKVKARWEAVRPSVKAMLTDIDATKKRLELSQQQNFKRWPILNKYVWQNAVVLGSYDKEVAYAKDFLTKRIAWIDARLALYPNSY